MKQYLGRKMSDDLTKDQMEKQIEQNEHQFKQSRELLRARGQTLQFTFNWKPGQWERIFGGKRERNE